jgi:hypothetical protein
MGEEKHDRERPRERRSAAAEAAALRWQERHPEEDELLEPEDVSGIGDEDGGPRRSASAEAAALRHRHRQPPDEE